MSLKSHGNAWIFIELLTSMDILKSRMYHRQMLGLEIRSIAQR